MCSLSRTSVPRGAFSDGALKQIDLSELMGRGGAFGPIREHREIFEQVRVNPDSRTVEWPGEVDLDPEVLYGLFEPASGVRIGRRTSAGRARRSFRSPPEADLAGSSGEAQPKILLLGKIPTGGAACSFAASLWASIGRRRSQRPDRSDGGPR
jgi:hypothetical protein